MINIKALKHIIPRIKNRCFGVENASTSDAIAGAIMYATG
jgi:hypothetical protein